MVFPVLALIDPSETLGIGPFEHKKSDFFRLRRAKSRILLSLSQVTLEISDFSRNRGGGGSLRGRYATGFESTTPISTKVVGIDVSARQENIFKKLEF